MRHLLELKKVSVKMLKYYQRVDSRRQMISIEIFWKRFFYPLSLLHKHT